MSGSLLLAIALAGVTEVRGVYRERLYTGACDREGVPGWQDGPAGGKRLFVRVAGEAPAPALAETVTAQDGTFAMSFRPPAAGAYCLAHQGKERLVCLTSFSASMLEGAVSTSVVIGPLNARPACVSQRRKARGQTRFVEEPCGDRGKPPRSVGGRRLWIHSLDARAADVGVTSDAAGRFETSLLPGRYCAGLQPQSGGEGEGCVARFEIADRDVDGVTVDFKRTCGRARGIGRVAALDGTVHVRGQVVHQTTYWGGAYRREPAPAVTTGNALRVRRGDHNGPQPMVAEVVTDEQGFDVALPPGVWCFETAQHDDWFKQWSSRPRQDDFDRACMKRKYETCDFVARLGTADLEGVRIATTQWHPPTLPCRAHPYSGSSPP